MHVHESSIFACEHYEFLVILQCVIKYNNVSKRVLGAYQIMYKTGIYSNTQDGFWEIAHFFKCMDLAVYYIQNIYNVVS